MALAPIRLNQFYFSHLFLSVISKAIVMQNAEVPDRFPLKNAEEWDLRIFIKFRRDLIPSLPKLVD